jgi:hypothetical protein
MKKIIIKMKTLLPLEEKQNLLYTLKKFLDSKENDVLLIEDICDIVKVEKEDVVILEDSEEV